MKKNEYNVKAINDAYKNAHIAMQSISDLLPNVTDAGLKKEMNEEYKGYREQIDKIADFMRENKITPKDIGGFKKTMLFCAIKMKTLFNKSKNRIAGMMVEGTGMGINELSAMKNESKNLDEGVLNTITELLKTEESYEKRLRKFL